MAVRVRTPVLEQDLVAQPAVQEVPAKWPGWTEAEALSRRKMELKA